MFAEDMTEGVVRRLHWRCSVCSGVDMGALSAVPRSLEMHVCGCGHLGSFRAGLSMRPENCELRTMVTGLWRGGEL